MLLRVTLVLLLYATWAMTNVQTFVIGNCTGDKAPLVAHPRHEIERGNRRLKTADTDDYHEGTAAALLEGPSIDKEGRIINKKKKLYSYGALEHVDDFFVGKYRVEWIVRGIKEKLRFRHRDSAPPPLRSSRFTFAGIGGFIIRLWLDGIYESKPGHIALSLLQQEHWTSLNSPICISAGDIKRGPFFFRSSPYFESIKSFCPLEQAVKNNTLRITIAIASR